MPTTFDATALLLDVFRHRRTALAIEQADLKLRIAALDAGIATAERLLDQHDVHRQQRGISREVISPGSAA